MTAESVQSAAENQSRYRSINEDVQAINTVFDDSTRASSEWICECADTECVTHVLVTLREYEAVRTNPRAFIVHPGHIYPKVERVIAESERSECKANRGGRGSKSAGSVKTSCAGVPKASAAGLFLRDEGNVHGARISFSALPLEAHL